MKESSSIPTIVFVSTFPPTQCGIATFTQDTVAAISKIFGQTLSCAICDINKNQNSNPLIKYTINPAIRESYGSAAKKINEDDTVKLVHIQHEFGLFGGILGDYLLDFLDILKKPVVFTFHSVIPDPNTELMSFVRILISYASCIFVMTRKSEAILKEVYGIDEKLITCVPHGTHVVNFERPEVSKSKLKLENRPILSTFGLLSGGKSIETALRALPEIIAHTPNILYLVIGKTHPNNIINGTDEYRDFLENMVDKLKLKDHVQFINRYVPIEELLAFLKATDIYLFTSKDPNQAVSGTFAYAMSCACPIVATSIPHTKEVLSTDAGILIDIDNSKQLAQAVKKLLSDTSLRESMAIQAFQKTRASSWENIAIRHIIAYNSLLHIEKRIQFNLPPIKLDHLKNMTTHRGIIQFSKISDPDIDSGYTLDDNARALIVMCLHHVIFSKKENMPFLHVYLNFIIRCQLETGRFINYIDKNDQEHIKNNYINLEDSNARAIWALGTVISLQEYLPKTIANRAVICLNNSLPWLQTLTSPRAIGFAIKGLFLCNTVAKNDAITSIIEKLGDELIYRYEENAKADWHWFENYLTYANSILPEAMLYTHLATGKLMYKKVAIESFDFLLSKMFVNNHFRVISNRGWYQKGIQPNAFGEQPIDVSCTFQTLQIFFKTFGDIRYEKLMKKVFNWFLGENHLNQIMYDPVTGGCYDGLEKDHVNLNQGAESGICYLMARLLMESYNMDKQPIVGRRKRSALKINSYLNRIQK